MKVLVVIFFSLSLVVILSINVLLTVHVQSRFLPAIRQFEKKHLRVYPNAVLAGDYWEKLTMSMNNLFDLVALADLWNATVPLPFTVNSYLYGIPTENSRKLDIIYNTEELNALMVQWRLPPFTAFEHFLLSASKNVIALQLNFGTDLDPEPQYPSNIYSGICTKSVFNLLSHLNIRLHDYNSSLQPFRVIKCCHILARHITSPSEISTKCGIQNMSRVTILLDQWRGVYYTQSNFRLYVKDFISPHPGPWLPLPYSKEIVNRANKLLLDRLNKVWHTKFIGVHLRSEKVRIKVGFNTTAISQCFQMVYKLSKKLAFVHNLPVFYFGDGLTKSVFGEQMTKYHIKLLKCNTIPSQKTDKGFEAQVEQAMVSRAEVLVLLGGGTFQLQIYSRYRRLKNTGLVYRVCDDTSRNYLSVINWKGPEWWMNTDRYSNLSLSF